MATTIKLKNGSGAPLAGDLVAAEPAFDLTNKRLYTEDSGGTVIEVGTNPGTDVTFADNRKAIFGAGSDLQIYHDGSHSRIDEQGTGVLFLQTNGTNIQLNKGTSENMLVANVDGSVDLYYDGSQKLATTATGIDVTGDVNSDSVTTGTFTSTGIDDNATSTAITIDSSENVGIGTASPGALLEVNQNAENVIRVRSADGAVAGILFGDQSDLSRGSVYYDNSDESMQFRVNNQSEAMRIDSSGRTLIGTTVADQDAKLTVVGSGAGGSSPATISANTVATFRRTGGLSHSANVSILGGSTGFSVLNLGDRDDEDVGRVYYDHTNNAMLFDTNATERMRIDSSGNVGINNSSPNGPLSIQPDSNSLLTSHGGGRYREFLKAGNGLDTTLRVDLSFTSQGSEWDQHIVELYICGGDAVASTQRVASLKYAVSTLTSMSTPTVLSQDLQGLTLTSSVASGLTLQVTVTSTADIDKFVVVAKVYSQESNGKATSLNVV